MNVFRARKLFKICIIAILVFTLLSIPSFGDVQNVTVSVIPDPKIDVVLSQSTTEADMTNIEKDLKTKLEEDGFKTNNVQFQTVQTETISTNAADASVIFNNWGRIGWTGQWSLTTIDGKYAIQNAENTDDYTGFYYPERFDYHNQVIEFDNRSTNGDDDMMGCMFRFNLMDDSTDVKNRKCSTYIFALDKHDSNGGIGNGAHNGLLKITNKRFGDASVEVLQNIPNVTWSRNSWAHYKIIIKNKNIKVYQNNNLIIDYTDNSNTYIDTGSYGFFSYSQPYAQYINYTAESAIQKSFQEVLHEPTWRDNAYHILVNVDDEEDKTMTGADVAGENSMRLLNDKIHLLQWGRDANKDSTINFIKQMNDGNGMYTDNSNYQQAVTDTANYIENLVKQGTSSQYVIVRRKY